MSKYPNKQYLIDENSDLNISEFDKELNYDALKGIISAKRNYNKAQQEGDESGMAKANAYANSIRQQSGNYTGGDDGSGYYLRPNFKSDKRPSYENKYAKKIDRLYDMIASRDDFSYNTETDPMFSLYKQIYEREGDLAYERALGNHSARTGGIANTNALSAASQAKAYYNGKLAEKATDLYNDSYKRYTDKTKDMYNQLEALYKAEKSDYEKYIKESDNFDSDRAFAYTQFADNEKNIDDAVKYSVETAYQKSRDDEADRKWQAEMDYKQSRDNAQDYKWQSEYDYQVKRDQTKDLQWQSEYDYQVKRDETEDAQWEKELSYKQNLSQAEIAKWKEQNEIDRYNTLAKLIQSIYNQSNIGVNVDTVKKILGL